MAFGIFDYVRQYGNMYPSLLSSNGNVTSNGTWHGQNQTDGAGHLRVQSWMQRWGRVLIGESENAMCILTRLKA